MELSSGMIQFPSQKYLESIGPSHPRHLPATGASHGGDFLVGSQVLLDRFVALLAGVHLYDVAACGNALPVGVVVACVGQNS